MNNSVRRRVIATSARATVALVGSSASWDFQHVRAALSRTPWAVVEAEVLDAPGARWSVAPADIPERSVVVLSDVAVDHLSSAQWDALYQFVAARGGSVLFVECKSRTGKLSPAQTAPQYGLRIASATTVDPQR